MIRFASVLLLFFCITSTAHALTAELLFTIKELQAPESVVYDPQLDLYFISNINGEGTAKDNNGFISRVHPDGKVESLKFIAGGVNGVTLNGPKGLEIDGNTLWVTDIDAVRAFDKRTGKLEQSADFAPLGAIFLNDIAVAPGAVYASDTGLRFDEHGNFTGRGPSRIFCFCSGKPTLTLEDPALAGPNGLWWLPAERKLLIVQLQGKKILTLSPAEKKLQEFAEGPGGFDGIVAYKNGYLVSSLDTSSVYFLQNKQFIEITKGIENPADIGLDSKRNRLLIPSFSLNQVQVWQLR